MQPQDSIATLLYRIVAMEKDIAQLKAQLSLYEPTRENDLKLQNINSTVGRIENELSKVKERIDSMNTRMLTQEQEAQTRDNDQRANQDKLQIRVLWWVVSTVFGVGFAVLIGYLTHLFH